jgi:hypothetical protein
LQRWQCRPRHRAGFNQAFASVETALNLDHATLRLLRHGLLRVMASREQRDLRELTRHCSSLCARFAYASRVVLTHAQLAHIVRRAPAGFGQTPDKYRYDIIFLRKPLAVTEAMRESILAAWVIPSCSLEPDKF